MFEKKLISQISLLTSLGALLPTVGAGEAAVITQRNTFSLTASPAEVSDPGTSSNSASDSTTVTFNQFDPSLGKLTEIDIALNSTLFGSVSVATSVEQSNSATTTWDASITLIMPGVNFSDTQSASASCDFACNTTLVLDPLLESDSATFTSGFPASYIGTGTLGMDAELHLTVSVSDNGTSGPATGSGSATWDQFEDLTLAYVYTPAAAPEPGTLALLGMGATAGLGIARRRSK
jgi:hypothetical protein